MANDSKEKTLDGVIGDLYSQVHEKLSPEQKTVLAADQAHAEAQRKSESQPKKTDRPEDTQDKAGQAAAPQVENSISDAEKRKRDPLPPRENAFAEIRAINDGEHVAYHRNGQEVFRDKGDTITFKPGADEHTGNMEAALRLAVEKFGDKGIVLNGTDSFKLQAMQVMLEKGIAGKFSDPHQAAIFEAVKHQFDSNKSKEIVSAPIAEIAGGAGSQAIKKNYEMPGTPIGAKMNAPEYKSAIIKLGGDGIGRVELPKEHCTYKGKVIQCSDTHIVQKVDKNVGVAHDVTKMANGKEILALAEKGKIRNTELSVNYNEKQAEAKLIHLSVDHFKTVIDNTNAWADKNIASPKSREAFANLIQDFATAKQQQQLFKQPVPVQIIRDQPQSQAPKR
jgi:hypothetical protein